jgi:hypothetical protein
MCLCRAALSDNQTADFRVSATTFLSNETLWQTITAQVKAAAHVDVAVAYFGQGGTKLLPLRKGDRLIVNMSVATVRAGGTDPREIEKLINRGVKAFTRRNLHAKLVVADKSVISGSANASQRAGNLLDEAAIWTNDPAVLRRARKFIDGLCTEPIRPEYLAKCKKLYEPPKVDGKLANGQKPERRVAHAKLWIVNLVESLIPDAELERYERGETKAAKLIKDADRSATESFHWSHKPKMADHLEVGDWFVQVIKCKDQSTLVHPPGQFLLLDDYARGAGKKRWVFHLETPKRGEVMDWSKFRKLAKSALGTNAPATPRTRPIRDVRAADSILSLWTPGGRISRK